MNLNQLIESQFKQLEDLGVNYSRMNKQDILLTKSYFDTVPQIIWINDFQQMNTFYINKYGKNYYGYTENDIVRLGFDLYKDLIHPDYFHDVTNAMDFFIEHPKGTSKLTFFAKVNDGSYRWTISCAKPLNFNEKGEPILLLSLVFDIENAIDLSLNGSSKLLINEKFVANNKHLYQQLSEREIDILKMIGKGFTSKEIGAKMNISPATVETHRTNLRSKLKAKNSIELVKFALLFHPEII